MLRAKSLAWRIFFASIALMPVLLGFSAFMLERAFRTSLYSAEKESLLAHTYSMMALAEPDEGFLLLPEELTDSRFNDPASGLYAQVVDDEFGPVWESISLAISPLANKVPFLKVATGNFYFSVTQIDKEVFFISRYNTVWEIDEQDREYQFTVIHSQAQLQREILNYRKTLAAWLGGLALLLIFLQTVIIRWGLLPLQRLATDIRQLEAGVIKALDKNYPQEIVPVTQNINLLLDSEQKQRKRYKNTLSDLAHSLKTPLSVIRSIMEKQFPAANEKRGWQFAVDEQVERMSNIISHQLNRASTSKASFLSPIELQGLFERISGALTKVYRGKNIKFSIRADNSLKYPAQEDDLMEVFGNMLENAFKYGKSKVCVSVEKNHNQLLIKIEDDGPGVPEKLRTEILKRGSRLDSSAPGQGIGLAVAADIISAYDGGISVETSPLGGACFIILLPY